jgi:hypothetical protein
MRWGEARRRVTSGGDDELLRVALGLGGVSPTGHEHLHLVAAVEQMDLLRCREIEAASAIGLRVQRSVHHARR